MGICWEIAGCGIVGLANNCEFVKCGDLSNLHNIWAGLRAAICWPLVGFCREIVELGIGELFSNKVLSHLREVVFTHL